MRKIAERGEGRVITGPRLLSRGSRVRSPDGSPRTTRIFRNSPHQSTGRPREAPYAMFALWRLFTLDRSGRSPCTETRTAPTSAALLLRGFPWVRDRERTVLR